MYQQTASRLAPGRTDAERFDDGLAFIARRLRFSVQRLDARDRQLLDDFGRGASRDGEVRYRMVTLRALCAIAGRSTRADDREALPELIRAEVLRYVDAPVSIAAAFDVETSVTGPTDVEQRVFERVKDRASWIRCRDALLRQLAATRYALDAVLMWSASI